MKGERKKILHTVWGQATLSYSFGVNSLADEEYRGHVSNGALRRSTWEGHQRKGTTPTVCGVSRRLFFCS